MRFSRPSACRTSCAAIVGEGGLNPALVPALSRLEPDEAAATAGDVLGVFALALLALTGLVEIGAGLHRASPRAGPSRRRRTLALVALYTRLSFPIVLCVTLASIGAALLNMRGRFGATALAPLAVNGGLILALVAIETGFGLPLAQKAAWLAAASSLAGLIQLVIVAAALLQGGPSLVRFRWPRWSPLLKSLLLAGLSGAGCERRGADLRSGRHPDRLVLAVGRCPGSTMPSASMQLPLGLMAALGASVLLPELARRYRAGETQAIVAAQNRALEAGPAARPAGRRRPRHPGPTHQRGPVRARRLRIRRRGGHRPGAHGA